MSGGTLALNEILVVAPIVAPAVSVATFVVKVRASNNRRARAYVRAAECYALAKSIGELKPDDVGSASTPYLRNDLLRAGHEAARQYRRMTPLPRRRMVLNWFEVLLYSAMCVLAGLAWFSVPRVFPAVNEILAQAMGWLFLVVATYALWVIGALYFQRRRAIWRLLKQKWKDREAKTTELERVDGPQISGRS